MTSELFTLRNPHFYSENRLSKFRKLLALPEPIMIFRLALLTVVAVATAIVVAVGALASHYMWMPVHLPHNTTGSAFAGFANLFGVMGALALCVLVVEASFYFWFGRGLLSTSSDDSHLAHDRQ